MSQCALSVFNGDGQCNVPTNITIVIGVAVRLLKKTQHTSSQELEMEIEWQ
jgi:hypothetical protein